MPPRRRIWSVKVFFVAFCSFTSAEHRARRCKFQLYFHALIALINFVPSRFFRRLIMSAGDEAFLRYCWCSLMASLASAFLLSHKRKSNFFSIPQRNFTVAFKVTLTSFAEHSKEKQESFLFGWHFSLRHFSPDSERLLRSTIMSCAQLCSQHFYLSSPRCCWCLS